MQILVALANQEHDSTLVEAQAQKSLARLEAYATDLGGKNLRSFSATSRLGTILYVESVHENCQWSFVQEDDRTVVVSLGYPRYWQSVLGVDERPARDSRRLTELCRTIQTDPLTSLEILSPPFLLVWIDKATGTLWLVNDGLGLAPAYEVNSGSVRGWTNKLVGMSESCGITLDPCPEDWQTKIVTGGYFLGDRCGFKNVAFMKPGTLTQVTDSGIKTRHIDALRKWFTRIDESKEALVDRCNKAMQVSVRDWASYWDSASTALSGGWDSRLVTSAAVQSGLKLPAYTIDRRGGIESSVAQRLAAIKHLDWSRIEGGMPATTEELAAALQQSVALMAGDGYHWGGVANGKLPSRIVDELTMGGLFGELPRGYFCKFVPKSNSGEPSFDEIVSSLADAVVANAPIRNKAVIQSSKEAVRQVCQEGVEYGFHGPAIAEFYYLLAKMRRWASVTIMGKAGQCSAHPCVDPAFIRAAFSIQPADKLNNAIAKAMLKQNCPEWADIPTAARRWRPKKLPAKIRSAINGIARAQARRNWSRPLDGRPYDHSGYLLNVARPLVDKALDSPGDLVASVVDVDAVRNAWRSCVTGSLLHPSRSTVDHKLIWEILSLATLEQWTGESHELTHEEQLT